MRSTAAPAPEWVVRCKMLNSLCLQENWLQTHVENIPTPSFTLPSLCVGAAVWQRSEPDEKSTPEHSSPLPRSLAEKRGGVVE